MRSTQNVLGTRILSAQCYLVLVIFLSTRQSHIITAHGTHRCILNGSARVSQLGGDCQDTLNFYLDLLRALVCFSICVVVMCRVRFSLSDVYVCTEALNAKSQAAAFETEQRRPASKLSRRSLSGSALKVVRA